jgi:hypothetical protein
MSGLLGNLSHAELMALREKSPPERQGMLAPYEHRAFAREATAENPLMALSLATAIPAYQLAKLLRLHGSRTGPSLEQMRQGYVGIGEGLKTGLLGK